MNVRDLIEKLRDCPPSAEVLFCVENNDGSCNWEAIESLEAKDLEDVVLFCNNDPDKGNLY